MLDQVQAQGQTKLLADPPLRLHHHAYAVKDQEVNRHFIEDILASFGRYLVRADVPSRSRARGRLLPHVFRNGRRRGTGVLPVRG